MRSKRFSIIVTSHNQRGFIRDAVDSALSQRRQNSEVIVVDDGSTDGSVEVLKEYGAAFRLVILPSNLGAIAARNQGAAQAQGEFLVFLDGDDALMPWALDVYEELIIRRSPKIILGRTRWFEGRVPDLQKEDGPREVEFVEYESILSKDRPVGLTASAYVVDRRAFWDAGGWSPGIFHLDLQDLSTKLGYSGHMILICSPSTAFYRIHAANSIHAVPPFLRMVHRLIAKDRAGEYPGGQERRFERRAWFGGLVVFWTKRAVRAGLYSSALKLLWTGGPMVIAAVVRRSTAWVRGRRPTETLRLETNKA